MDKEQIKTENKQLKAGSQLLKTYNEHLKAQAEQRKTDSEHLKTELQQSTPNTTTLVTAHIKEIDLFQKQETHSLKTNAELRKECGERKQINAFKKNSGPIRYTPAPAPTPTLHAPGYYATYGVYPSDESYPLYGPYPTYGTYPGYRPWTTHRPALSGPLRRSCFASVSFGVVWRLWEVHFPRWMELFFSVWRLAGVGVQIVEP